MHQEKYDLRWNTYSDHLKEMLHEMMKSEDLTDVTLICDDKKQLKAHKVVLSACSSVFKSIIGNLPLNNSVIYLRGVQHQEMESILEFMYLGVAKFYQERMNEFWDVAKSLDIKEISNHVEFGPREDETSVHDDLKTENVTQLDMDNQNEDVDEDIENIDRNEKSENCLKSQKCCSECGKLFANQWKLMRHYNSIHKGVKFQCKSCDKEYSSTDTLKFMLKVIMKVSSFYAISVIDSIPIDVILKNMFKPIIYNLQ